MLTKQAYDQAYMAGVQRALEAAGLVKQALVGELAQRIGLTAAKGGAKGVEPLISNPNIARMLVGGAAGGAIGGMSDDIGAGRGMLAGGLAGLASGYGAGLGRQALRGGYTRGVEDIAAQKLKGAEKIKALRAHNKAFGIRGTQALDEEGLGALKSKGWNQRLNTAGTLGGLGMGGLAAGGTLALTPAPPQKHWWE